MHVAHSPQMSSSRSQLSTVLVVCVTSVRHSYPPCRNEKSVDMPLLSASNTMIMYETSSLQPGHGSIAVYPDQLSTSTVHSLLQLSDQF